MNERERLAARCRHGVANGVPAVAERRAVLVSERHAVWTKPAAVGKSEDGLAAELAAIADPVWDHAGGTRWTPDLVHCRLLDAADTICRLPRGSMAGFRSLLTQLADPDPDAALNVKAAPLPAQVSIADWTMRQVIRQPHEARQLLLGMAFGLGVRKVGAKIGLGKSQVSRRYLSWRRYLASEWQGFDEPLARVDTWAFDRWRDLFEKNATK